MNGDTNGTMDDPLDTASDMADLITISDLENSEKKISDHGDNSPDVTKDSNMHDEETTKPDPVESDPFMHDEETTKPDPVESDPFLHDDETTKTDPAESDPLVPLKENTDSIEEDGNKTNESYPNSVESLQSKAESNEQNITVKLSENQAKEGVKHTDLDEADSQHTAQDSDVLDSEADTSEDDISEDNNQKAIDTVSIDSDSEVDSLNDEDNPPNKQSDIIFVDSNISKKQNGIRNCGSPSEVHEIESDNDDDCVMTSEELKSKSTDINNGTRILRRSRRALKRKSYAGDDDIEVIGVDNSKVKNKKKPTAFMNHVKSFLDQASKHRNLNKGAKKDTVHKMPLEPATQQSKHNDTVNVEELYQSIAARGTTVTPLSKVKTTSANVLPSGTVSVSTQCSSPPVLPYLTDDMFVVEAPSFIVPYVYEKPSVKAFREFVDNLGKQLEEELAQENEKLRKESEEDSEKSEITAVQTGGDAPIDELPKKDKRHGRRKKDDDSSWDGSEESNAESDDEILSDEDKKVVIKDVDDVEITKKVLASTDKTLSAKKDTYFDCSLGKFFMEIGINQVEEYVQNDLLKLQNRKLTKEKKSGKRTRETELAIALLTKNIDLSKRNNAEFTFTQKKCQFCSFQTESMLVMSNHFETPHMKNGMYKCNFCPAELRTPHEIYMHMDVSHKVRGKLEKAPGNHQCANCPFEDNGKGKLARHLIACAKRFKPEFNLSPPIEWEPPAKIPKITKSRPNVMTGFPAGFKGPQINNNLIRPPINIGSGPLTAFKPRPQLPTQNKPAMPSRPNILVRHFSSPPVGQQFKNGPRGKPANQQPSISITPLPRAPQFAPSTSATSPAQGKGTFVICEICDGYIKDLEQLRNHMQWIHKVKIHPKMIYNRPPLNCQKCQFRFFTDQGLERHLLGTHGLVTSSMQEAANKGKDAGRCPVCGRVYQWKLLHHVAKDHNLTLKPAHLSYKCTVCTATFGMYKQFENHVYSAHRVVAKRVMDSSKVPPTAKAADTPKDEVND